MKMYLLLKEKLFKTIYRLEHIKIKLINQNKLNGQNSLFKYLELILLTLSSTTPIGTK